MRDDLLVVGLSHRTAPLDIRERLAAPADRVTEGLRGLVEGGSLSEVVWVSTCNRVEIYAASPEPKNAAHMARAFLASKAAPTPLDSFIYERQGVDAIRHAFRVASSLDSMVIGEPQILGQVKDAFTMATQAGSVGTLLGRFFNRTFAVAKRVRTETAIAAGTVSVSSIACELAKKIFSSLQDKRVLLLGAGKMGETSARYLANQGAKLFVINRSYDRAVALAEACGGEPRKYEELEAELAHADVVISSTASPRFVVTTELMRDVGRARRRRPLFLIDIAVPRDIDPRVGEMQNVFLYDLDDLQKVADENLELRRREAEAAEKIIDAEVKLFDEWRKSLELTDTIVALRERFSELVRKEVTRSLPRLRDQAHSEYDPVEAFTQSLVNKLLHHPLTELKKGAHDPDGATVVEVTHRLFDLRRPESRTTTSSEPPQRREEDEPTEAPKRTRKDSL